MSNLMYDPAADEERVRAWAAANQLDPEVIFAETVFVEPPNIRFRAAVEPGQPMPLGAVLVGEPPHTEWATPFQTMPLLRHPFEFGIGVTA